MVQFPISLMPWKTTTPHVALLRWSKGVFSFLILQAHIREFRWVYFSRMPTEAQFHIYISSCRQGDEEWIHCCYPKWHLFYNMHDFHVLTNYFRAEVVISFGEKNALKLQVFTPRSEVLMRCLLHFCWHLFDWRREVYIPVFCAALLYRTRGSGPWPLL